MTHVTPTATAEFLQQLTAAAPETDDATRQQVRQALADRPDAAVAAVEHAMRLESELATARHEIARLRRMHPAPASPAPSAEDLQRQSEAWGRLLGTASKPRSAPSASVARAPRARTFEDVGARFLADHAGKVWIFLLLLTAVVVSVKENLI